MTRLTTILLLFFLGTTIIFSQQTDAQKDLLKRAEENHKLLQINLEKAYEEAIKIIEEAQRLNAWEAELRAIATQCIYYETNNDFKNMIIFANSLSKKAKSYNNPTYQAIARLNLFKAYFFSGLPDKALSQLKEANKILAKTNINDPLTITIKADLYIGYSNYHLLNNNFENALEYVKLAGQKYKKLPDDENRQKLLYIYYSNLAGTYSTITELDSAKYYAQLSQSEDKNYNRNEIKHRNLSILGEVAMKKADYRTALSHFKEAENLEGYQNYLNILRLYDSIIKIYQALNEDENIRIYESKQDSLRLTITKSQNKSLHNLLSEEEKNTNSKYIYGLVFFLVLMGVIMFFIIRKNIILTHQEKVSQKYLNENPESQNGVDYSKLLEMLKKNDLAFMPYFDKMFPDFTPKLLTINPTIIPSEIEFCALLKLKIPTHDIARYKYITLKSVQNRKYLIRKKLNIPKGVDIYNWFSSL